MSNSDLKSELKSLIRDINEVSKKRKGEYMFNLTEDDISQAIARFINKPKVTEHNGEFIDLERKILNNLKELHARNVKGLTKSDRADVLYEYNPLQPIADVINKPSVKSNGFSASTAPSKPSITVTYDNKRTGKVAVASAPVVRGPPKQHTSRSRSRSRSPGSRSKEGGRRRSRRNKTRRNRK